MDIGTMQGLIGVFCGLILFVMGYFKGRSVGVSQAIDTLIAMRILKIKPNGDIVRGEKLDLE